MSTVRINYGINIPNSFVSTINKLINNTSMYESQDRCIS